MITTGSQTCYISNDIMEEGTDCFKRCEPQGTHQMVFYLRRNFLLISLRVPGNDASLFPCSACPKRALAPPVEGTASRSAYDALESMQSLLLPFWVRCWGMSTQGCG